MVKEIIPKHTKTASDEERKAWIDAANNWRLPYWDWASSLSVPLLANGPEFEAPMPDGSVIIPNPMYKFTTPDKQPFSTHGVPDLKHTDPHGIVTFIPASLIIVTLIHLY